MSTTLNNAKIVDMCGQRLTALKKHVKTKTAMKVSGESIKPADLVAAYQAAIDTRAALIPQRASYKKALAARDNAEVSRQATDRALKAWVINEFGPDSQEAQEFGFLPAKVTPASVETKADAVKLARLTRAARGTKGKRQKEKIKGTIVAPNAPADPATTTPADAPSTVVPTPTNGAPANGASSSNGTSASH